MSAEAGRIGDLERLVCAVADRLRGLPRSRLAAPAEAGHRLAQWLADAAAGVERRGYASAPRPRAVPRLGVFAVGDQIAVTGADLVAAAAVLDPAVEVWSPAGARLPLSVLLADAEKALQELRRSC